MADEKYNDDDKPSKKGGEFRVPPRTWIVWIAIFDPLSGMIAPIAPEGAI